MTSSHKFRPRQGRDQIHGIVFKRPQVRQCRGYLVRVTARTPPPAFLFPNQQCQRPDCLSAAPLFSAGGRRRRLSSGRPLWCQSVLSDFFASPQKPRRAAGNWRKNRCQGCRGQPSLAATIRLRLRNLAISVRNARIFWKPSCPPRKGAARAGGGCLIAASMPVNRSFRSFSPEPG